MQRKCVLFDGEGGSNGTVDVKVYVRTDNVNVLPQADYLEDDDLVVYATKEFQVSDVTEQDELKAGAWKLVCSGTVTGAYQYRCFAGPNSSVKVVVRNNSNKYSKGGVWHN